MVDRRSATGDGVSTIVAERNLAGVVDFVERQRAAPSASSAGSRLGHLAGGGAAMRRIPVANVQPIMKDTVAAAAARVVTVPPAASEMSALARRAASPDVTDSCLPLSTAAAAVATSSMSTAAAPAGPGKDAVASFLAAPGLSRGGGRVSSHHMEYVKFLRQSVDDAASLSTASAAVLGPARSTGAERRRAGAGCSGGRGAGALACLSAKARRQLLPYFHRDDHLHRDGQPAASVPDAPTAVAASGVRAATSDSKLATGAAASASSEPATAGPSCGSWSASAARKTTPIVYFDDDESAETASSSTLTGSESSAVQHWRDGPSTRRHKPRRTPRNAERSLDAADGTRGVVSKRRRRVTAAAKAGRVNDEAAAGDNDDDELTDFEDAQPSTSAQVCQRH